MTNEKNSIDINFPMLLNNILRRLWLIILVAVLCAGAAYTYVSFFVTPIYSSTATLYIGNSTGGIDNDNITLSKSLAKDYEEIIKKRAVLEDVVKTLDLDMSAGQLKGCISVKNITDTRILDISVSTSDAATSKKIADAICTVASDKFVSITKVDYVSIVDYGNLSSAPSNKNVTMSMLLAAISGVLICTFIITVHTLMDDKIKSPEDVEYYLGLSVLGTTPFSRDLTSNGSSSGGRVLKKH